MAAYSWLRIGDRILYGVREWYSSALAAAFRDTEQRVGPGPDEGDPPAISYVVVARAMRDRLDALGFTVARADVEIARAWPVDDPDAAPFAEWLAGFADSLSSPEPWRWSDVPSVDLDPRLLLRRLLVVTPDNMEVALDLSEVTARGYVQVRPTLCAEAFAELHVSSASFGPLVVLTEGSTDAEFLIAALQILFPHVAGYVTFLDYYAQRSEGGVGALVRAVKAFAAAGIANRIVAVFDNDTAAAEALAPLDLASLPLTMRVVQLPELELAKAYPTLGPTGQSPWDVNGLAGSLELYLGRDVLTQPDGGLMPVQWRGYSTRLRRYQGEVLDKSAVHQAFRAKVAKALASGDVQAGDWEGLQLVLERVLQPF